MSLEITLALIDFQTFPIFWFFKNSTITTSKYLLISPDCVRNQLVIKIISKYDKLKMFELNGLLMIDNSSPRRHDLLHEIFRAWDASLF